MRSFLRLKSALLLLLMFGLVACTSIPPAEFTAVELPEQLSETSGLLCVADELISFNDSGGAAVLYRLNRVGQLRSQLQLSVRNIDWEATSLDDEFLYLADSGNNSGQRRTVLIHKIPLDWSELTQPYQPETLEISLPQQHKPKSYQHDLDFEALVYQQGALWLLSKSWQSQQPRLYRLDPKLKQQQLGQGLPLQSPGFLITDASIDSRSGHLWLVGYTDPRQAIWAYLSNSGFQAQIARYDQNLRLLESKSLPTRGQVEGLCIDRKQQIWLSEEGSAKRPARLLNTGLHSQ